MTLTAYKAVINYHCDDCFSSLISINNDNDFYCKSCGEIFRNEYFIEEALNNEFGLNIKEIQQGGEGELYTCPNCDKDTYTRTENICHLCGETQELQCMVCGDDIADLLECNGICYHCRSKADKD